MALGEDVSSIETTLKLPGASPIENLHPRQQMDMRSQYHKMNLELAEQKCPPLDGGLRLAQGSAADLDCLNHGARIFKGHSGISQQGGMRQDESSSKRKRVDSSGDTGKCRSRDQMPPPPIPIQQPFVYKDGVSSSDLHCLNSHDKFHARRFSPRASMTPDQHLFEGSLNPSMLLPSLSMDPRERPNTSLAGARTNNGQSYVDRHQIPRTSAGIAGPVYERGGWQTPAAFSDIGRSGSCSSSLMFPIDLGARTIDPRSRSYQVSSEGSSSYHRRQSAAPSRFHSPSPNREGRITLSRTSSGACQHSSDKGIGLFNHVRSSSHHTDHQSTNRSSHRQQLMIASPAHQRVFASPHFSSRQPTYDSSLPFVGGPYVESFGRWNSLDSAPTPVNGKMRPFSSTNDESSLLAQIPRAVTRGRDPLVESQAPSLRRRANR